MFAVCSDPLGFFSLVQRCSPTYQYAIVEKKKIQKIVKLAIFWPEKILKLIIFEKSRIFIKLDVLVTKGNQLNDYTAFAGSL